MEPVKQTLPQELLDNFADEIGREYIGSFPRESGSGICHKTLMTFLSVSRSFHDRSIEPLFRRVHLTNGPGRDIIQRISALRQIMKPTPGSTLRSIAPCIQVFTLFLNATLGSANNQLEPLLGGEGHEWLVDILSNEDLSSLFDDLHQEKFGIRSLAIHLATKRNVEWTELPPRFLSSMLSLIRSPHLQRLRLCDIHHLPRTFLQGSHLKDLHLKRLNTDDLRSSKEHDDPQGHNLPCPKLKGFHTDNSFPVDLGPATSPLTNLKIFMSSCFFPRHYSSTQKILQLAQNTLEEIKLTLSGRIIIPAEPIDFGRIPRLRTLTLFQINTFSTTHPALNDLGMAHICQLLNPSSPINSLTELNLLLHFSDKDVKEDFLHPQPNSQWQDIDTILTSTKYPALRRVSVQVASKIILDPGAIFIKKQYVQDTSHLLREAFARLSASEKIDLTVKVDASILRRRAVQMEG